MIKNISHNWLYADTPYTGELHTEQMKRVHLPHANKEVPQTYFDEKIYQFVSHYAKIFTVTAEEAACRSMVMFEGVMASAKVYLNGELLGEHLGGYTGFTFEMTGKLTEGENTLVVEVDSAEPEGVPPFGFAIDYLTFGGIYRDVSLRFTGSTYISNVFAKPEQVLEEKKALTTDVTLNATTPESGTVTVTLTGDGVSESVSKDVTLEVGETVVSLNLSDLTGIQLWDLDNPALYTVSVEYKSDSCADDTSTRVGFRTAEFTDHGFYLNGKNVKIRGLNRHQSYPYVGYAMPARAQRKDADILKMDLGLNLARTSHYPNSKYFLDRCDEIGLMVFTEIPGWQHIGNEAWKKVAVQNVREMICTDRNHPCIILWGVRINESKDDHDFYTETNALAHQLDPTRQTGGVRCIKNSELLEDVYTMNEFNYNGHNEVMRPQQEVTGLDHNVPYLITEFAGHKCPTKRFDREEQQIEQAERHLLMHNAVGMDDSVSGAIGWCAFDYHTHNNFGSGDRICYHGVSDINRMYKMAAHFYRSQRDRKYGAVLEAATHWTVGDRDGGGINPIYIFTNCDYVKVYTNGKEIGTYYPAKDEFPGVPYPPCRVTNFNVVWGQLWGSARFEGYIDDELVIERFYAHDPVPTTLTVVPDDKAIDADGIDVTRVEVKACDQAGNPLPYFFSPAHIEVTGAGELIGDTDVSLIAGTYGFWVRAGEEKGTINIKVSNPRLGETTAEVEVL